MERATFYNYFNGHPAYIFFFPTHYASAQTTYVLIECLNHYYGFLHTTASDQGIPSRAKEVWAYAHEIYWSYYVTHHPEAAGMTSVSKVAIPCRDRVSFSRRLHIL